MSGQVMFFRQFIIDQGNKVHDLDDDTYKFALIDDTVVPVDIAPDPHFGGTGATDYAANEVTAGGNYPAGGIVLTSTSYQPSANTAIGAATDAAGYPEGATNIGVAAGTGAIQGGEGIRFAGDDRTYLVHIGIPDISLGGTLVIKDGLNKALPASATAITQVPSAQWRANKISIAQDNANPTNARRGIIYNDTDPNKRCVAFVDLELILNLSIGLFEFKFNGIDGISTILTVH